MTAEELLILAREFCARARTQITDFAALSAAAAVSTARIEGIAVHGTRAAAAEALRRCLIAVPALRAHNAAFARFCAEAFLRLP